MLPQFFIIVVMLSVIYDEQIYKSYQFWVMNFSDNIGNKIHVLFTLEIG